MFAEHRRPAVQDPAEYALVMKALTSGLSNCVAWVNQQQIRVFWADPDRKRVTPEMLIAELIEYVRGGGQVSQVVERRPEYNHRRFYYKAILPLPGFPLGFFVEMELEEDTDPDVPAVWVVNAHPQR